MTVTSFTVDSPLGSWTHHEWRPAQLAGIVENMWHFDGRMTLPRERTFPGGYLELILHIGPLFRDVDARGITGARFPVFCLTGMQTRPVVIEAPQERCCVMGIRLRPVGAYVLFARAVADTTDLTVDLTDLAGKVTRDLADRCRELPGATQRFQLVANWLSERLSRSQGAHRAIAWAAAQLETSHGAGSIAAIRDRIGLGKTRFAESFREHVGVTPKRYARVLRFRHALELLQKGRALSSVALDAGYFDQSHMNADFREMAGMTPTDFISAVSYPNSPSLQEPANEIAEAADISPRRKRRVGRD